jgi:hypothetical protein
VRHVPTSRLTRRRQQLLDELGALGPVLRATVIERFTQCGKGNCKCMRGEKHGPAYYLAVSYAKGRTRQVYIPNAHSTHRDHFVQTIVIARSSDRDRSEATLGTSVL